MPFNPDLKPGDTITNEKLRTTFKCGSQGGMRRSRTTNTLVLISDKTKSFYQDEWREEVLHYTGMGQKRDQRLDFHQNKTLAESNQSDIDVHLFEVYEKNRYVYQGLVRLVGEPYQTTQEDFEGARRQVWVFPLKIEGESAPIPEEVFRKNMEAKERQMRKLSTEDLLGRLKSTDTVQTRKTLSNQRVRDAIVSELAKRRAKGVCQLCGLDAPFFDKDDEPYLEVHHVEWLSRGGMDSLNNTVALCPNCHRKIHVLDQRRDREQLKEKALLPVE